MIFSFVFAISIRAFDQKPSSQTEYTYVEQLGIVYMHQIGDAFYFGSLDATGRFVPNPKNPPRIISGAPNKPGDVGSWPPTLTLSSTPDGRLYEFHGGRLVPGHVKRDEKTKEPFFYPDLEGKIIEISEYLKTYDPNKSTPIYNLPGKIVKKGEK